jgi:hypothetical protein
VGSSITSANSSITLVIPGVYSSGVLLQNFSTDGMLDADPQVLTEPRVGVDWNVVGDYVLALRKFRMMFQANSVSIPVIYKW